MKQYFAVVGDGHDAKDPLTLVRVSESGLSEYAAWVPSKLVERIEAGEVPYRLVPVAEKAAARTRKQREKKVAYRYSIFVRATDPTNTRSHPHRRRARRNRFLPDHGQRRVHSQSLDRGRTTAQLTSQPRLRSCSTES
jgi:hypothetical protein